MTIESQLGTDDDRRILAVLEVAERATSLEAFRASTLAALDEHLGYGGSIFLVGPPPDSGHPPVDGLLHGYAQKNLEAYVGT